MRSQQEAERAEQQRIKSLVLNYDLNNNSASDDANGAPDHNGMLRTIFPSANDDFHYVLRPSRHGHGPHTQLVGAGVLNDPLSFDYRDLKRLSRRRPGRVGRSS